MHSCSVLHELFTAYVVRYEVGHAPQDSVSLARLSVLVM